jgi:hypothetical protein
MAVFSRHQVAFDMYYGLNKTSMVPPMETPPQIQTDKSVLSQPTYAYWKELAPPADTPTAVSLNRMESSIHNMTQPLTVMAADTKALSYDFAQMPVLQTNTLSSLRSQDQHLGTIAANTQAAKPAAVGQELMPKDLTKAVLDINTAISTQMGTLRTTITTSYTGLLGQLQTVNKSVLGASADMVGTINAGVKGLEGALASNTGAITTAIYGAAQSITMALYESKGGGGSGGEGGGGGLGSGSPFDGFSVFRPGDNFGSDSWRSSITSFASGGDFITKGARLIRVGEAGPERVTITPLSESRSLNMELNASEATKQITDLMKRIESNPITLRVQLELDTDSYNLQTLIENAVKVAMQGVRVR